MEDDKEFKEPRNVILKELKRLQEDYIEKDKIREGIENMKVNLPVQHMKKAQIVILEELLEWK